MREATMLLHCQGSKEAVSKFVITSRKLSPHPSVPATGLHLSPPRKKSEEILKVQKGIAQ
jgi:hypothetical protein